MGVLSAALAAWLLGTALNGGAAPVAGAPKDVAKVPEPAALYLRPAGQPADAKLPLLVYLHCKYSSPAESQPVMAPLVEAWQCALLMPCGSTKMGIKQGGMPVYDWHGQKDEDAVVREIKAARGVNPKGVFLIGFSAGAFMAYQVALHHPDLFAGVIALSGDIPRKHVADVEVQAAAPKIPFVLIHGEKDSFFPPSRGQKTTDYLTAHGFPALLKAHGGGHFFPDDLFGAIKEAMDWFETKPQAPEATGPIFLRPSGLEKGRRTALIVFLHGSASSPEDSLPAFAPLVDAWKCSVLYPRGSRRLGVLPSGRIAYDWDSSKDVDGALEAIRKLEGVDPERVILTGFSSGAGLCYEVALRAPGMFVGVIPFSGSVPGACLAATNRPAVVPKVAFYIVHGDKDNAVPLECARTAESYLKKNGLPVKVVTHDGAHYFPDNVFDVVKEAIDWFDAKRNK